MRLVIPLGPNDVEMIALTVEAARRNILETLESITIVCPAAVIDTLPVLPGVAVVDERDAIGDLVDDVQRAGHGGWVIQQFVKLACDRLADDLPVLCLDADTVLVTPQRFLEDGKIVRLAVNEHIATYYAHMDRVLRGAVEPGWASYVAHQMVFEPTVLRSLRATVTRLNEGRPWDRVLLEALDPDVRQGFSMSEFELYGHFCLRNPEREIVHRAPFNRPLLRRELADVEELERRWGPSFRSISFHSYMEQGHIDRLLGSSRWHRRDRRFRRVVDEPA